MKLFKQAIILLCAAAFAVSIFPAAQAAEDEFFLTIFAYKADGEKIDIQTKTPRILTPGLTAFQAARKYCEETDTSFTGTGNYVSEIAGYREKAQGKYSGWIYHVDGAHMKGPSSGYKIKAGQHLEWFYAVTAAQAGMPEASSRAASPSTSAVSAGSSAPAAASSSPASAGGAASSFVSVAAGTSASSQTTSMPDWTPVASESGSPAPSGESPEQLSDVIARAAAYLKQNPSPWAAFALRAGGFSIPRNLKKDLRGEIAAAGKRTSATDYQRLYFGAAAAGLAREPLAQKSLSLAEIKKSTLNAAIFALHVSNARRSLGEDGGDRAGILSLIQNAQKPDGSFALTAELAGDIDVTAMAVSALAASGDEGAKAAAGRAVAWLKNQTPENSESVSQLLLAAHLYGDSELEVQTAAQLMAYRRGDGGFSHEKGEESDPMATEQALIALSAVHFRRNPYLPPDAKRKFSTAPFYAAAIVLLFTGAALPLILRRRRMKRGME